jgi:hypothetical protein
MVSLFHVSKILPQMELVGTNTSFHWDFKGIIMNLAYCFKILLRTISFEHFPLPFILKVHPINDATLAIAMHNY